jgi:hypothetical protein
MQQGMHNSLRRAVSVVNQRPAWEIRRFEGTNIHEPAKCGIGIQNDLESTIKNEPIPGAKRAHPSAKAVRGLDENKLFLPALQSPGSGKPPEASTDDDRAHGIDEKSVKSGVLGCLAFRRFAL